MTGSVRRRGKTWRYVVDVGTDPTGKRRQRFRGGFSSRRVAEDALREFLNHLDRGGSAFPEAVTFGAYAERWLRHHQSQVEPMTYQRYEQLLRLHLLPVLGDMALDKIRAGDVQLALDGIDRAPRTVRQARAVLSKSFGQAVAWGLISVSPVYATHAPKADRPRLNVPEPHSIGRLLEVAGGSIWEMPVFLAIYTGARRGEVLALGWEHMDLDRRRIRIERSLEKFHGEYRFKDPKMANSRRAVAVSTDVGEQLRRLRALQNQRRLAAGEVWDDSDLVCDRGDGAPIDPDSVSKVFKRLAGLAGLRDVRLHDLRHAAATTLMEQGVHMSIVTKTLGHSNEAFTMMVYGHVRDDMLDQAADALDLAYGTKANT